MCKSVFKIVYFTIFLTVTAYSQGNWEIVFPQPTSNQMVSLDFIDDNTGLCVGEYGTILKSIDGGNNWRIVEIPYLQDLSDVDFVSSKVAYAVGTDGHIIKTTDAGESWLKQEIKYTRCFFDSEY